MTPASTVYNPANVSSLQTKIVSNCLGRLVIFGSLANFANKVIGQFSRIMGFTFHQSCSRYSTRKMRPTYSMHYMQNIGSRTSKRSSNGLLRFSIGGSLANFVNIRISKKGSIVIDSFTLSMLFLIFAVRFLSIPSQVFNAIISSIAVVMTSLHPCRTRTNKGSKDKSMDRLVVHSPISTNNDDKQMTVLVVCPGTKLKPSITNSPMSASLEAGEQCAISSSTVVWIVGNWFAVIWKLWCVHSYYYTTHGTMVQA